MGGRRRFCSGGTDRGGWAEEFGGQSVGVVGQIEGFAHLEEDAAALEALVRVLGEFGVDMKVDVLLGEGDFASFRGKVDGFAEVAGDVGPPWVLRRFWGLAGGGFGLVVPRRFVARTRPLKEEAGGEAVLEGDRFVNGAAEAEEDLTRIGAAGAARFLAVLIRCGRRGFLVRLAESEIGQFYAELDEALENAHIVCWYFGRLLE